MRKRCDGEGRKPQARQNETEGGGVSNSKVGSGLNRDRQGRVGGQTAQDANSVDRDVDMRGHAEKKVTLAAGSIRGCGRRASRRLSI